MNMFSKTTESKLMLPEPGRKYRLVTRSDMDGLVCAVILKELDLVSDILFVHPNDMQHGRIPVGPGDITTNLPYVANAFICFDHHASEVVRNSSGQTANHVIDEEAASASRVVFEYFGGRGNPALNRVSDEMMAAVDRADSADFSQQDILHPEKWALLSLIMDPRTGLGRFSDFTISNYQLMMKLIDYCRDHTIDEILALPDVRERIDLYLEHQTKCRAQLERCTVLHKNLIVLDLRQEDIIWSGNRFMIYALFPQCNISMHVFWGKNEQNTVFAVGKSIFNRTSNTHVGALMLEYGGGGHENVGACQVENYRAERVRREIIDRINADG